MASSLSLHQPLRTYIRQNLSHLRSKPCLLITSIPPPPNSLLSTPIAGTKSPSSITLDADQQKSQREQLKSDQAQNDKRIHSFVERNTQSITMEFGLKSVPFGISTAYPTVGTVGEAVALAKRAGLKEGGRRGSLGGGGDGVVIGIGSGAAIDLAKAVADSMFGTVDDTTNGNDDDGSGSSDYGPSQLVLAPCTLSGLWAASSNSPSLLLDTKEEMILPHLSSSWNNNNGASSSSSKQRRVGTTVTMDATQLLALPPLYTEFIPMKRTGYSVPPSMAHVAAAALAILLDAARSVDAAAGASSTLTAASGDNSSVEQLTGEMKHVAASCASVLHLAATTQQQQNEVVDEEATMQAQQHLLNAIPRLSPLIEQSSLLLSSSSSSMITTTGTIPQRLANALLPTYFPQCHIVTYLACTLPGLCEVLSSSSSSSSHTTNSDGHAGNNTSTSMVVEEVAKSIMSCIGENNNISHVVTEAGIPSMASLAYGTPDMNTLIGSLDSYESLIASTIISGGASGGGQDESWIMEDVLQRSLSR